MSNAELDGVIPFVRLAKIALTLVEVHSVKNVIVHIKPPNNFGLLQYSPRNLRTQEQKVSIQLGHAAVFEQREKDSHHC